LTKCYVTFRVPVTVTTIEWTDATWNPVTGCTRVSPGCANCYIERTPPFRMAGLPARIRAARRSRRSRSPRSNYRRRNTLAVKTTTTYSCDGCGKTKKQADLRRFVLSESKLSTNEEVARIKTDLCTDCESRLHREALGLWPPAEAERLAGIVRG
jgi:protein gp37